MVLAQERCLISAGVLQGHRVLRFAAPPPYATGFSSFHSWAFKNLMIRTLVFRVPNMHKHLGQGEKERIAQSYIDMIYEFNPDHVRGPVFALIQFARFLTNYGLDAQRLSVKSAIFSAESTTEEERRSIGKLWNAEPFDVYASTEMSSIAYECKSHSGTHINENYVFVTSVDPESGEELGEKEQGRDLCTCLFEDDALPGTFFINYSHGDEIAMLPGSCSYGNISKLSTHPTRNTKKRAIRGFGFDVKEQRPFLSRAVGKMLRTFE